MFKPNNLPIPPPPSGKTGWPWTVRDTSTPLVTLPAPKITIVTPSYMQGEFIETTIRSVLLQHYPSLEYIIIDGGSTDRTTEVIRKYEPWITYWVSEPDKGQTDALNKGLQRATGEIIGFINSDDWYHPGALAAVAARLKAHPAERLWAGWVDNRAGTQALGVKTSQYTNLVEYLGRVHVFHQPGIFWHREIQDKLGLFDERLHYGFDHEYFARMLTQGYKPVSLDAPIATFRLHGESKSGSQAHLFMREIRQVAESYRHLLTDSEWNKVRWLLNRSEADYLVDSTYSLLLQGKRCLAISHLLKRIRLCLHISPKRLYFGALFRALAGRPPKWYCDRARHVRDSEEPASSAS